MKQWRAHYVAGHFGMPGRRTDREIVFRFGDPVTRVYFLHRGAVEIMHTADDGRAVLVKILVGPCLFGSIEVLGKVATYLESVRVLGTADVVAIDATAFGEMLRCDGALAYECLSVAAEIRSELTVQV